MIFSVGRLSDRCFLSCLKIIFSRKFQLNSRLHTGLKCFKSFVSSQGLLKSGITTTCLNCTGTVPEERETLIIAVINSTKSFRHYFMREVGIGSNMKLLVGNWTKRESMGPSNTAKVGGSHKRESKSSRRLFILPEKKSQKYCGSSERRTSDGRSVAWDLPNSLLDTENSCRLEQTESILSR